MTTSIRPSRSTRSSMAETISGGSAARRTSRSSVADSGSAAAQCSIAASSAGISGSPDSTRSAGSGATGDLQVADGGRDEARLGDADEGLLEQQRHGGDLGEAGLLETSIGRRLVGSHGRENPVIRMAGTVARRLGGDLAEPERDQRARIELRPDQQAQVMRLVLAGDAELDEAVDPRPVGGVEDVAIEVGEAQDRGERAARYAPVRALA